VPGLLGRIAAFVIHRLLFRRIALQAMRDRYREARAAWPSSAMPGLLHLADVIVSGGAAVFQAFWAIGVGYLPYLCRRVGRGVVLPIVVHWLWDSSTFGAELGLDDDPVLGDLQFAMFPAVDRARRRRGRPSARGPEHAGGSSAGDGVGIVTRGGPDADAVERCRRFRRRRG
jgi:hypothetical protein